MTPAPLDAELIQAELDLAYHNMMAARTETGERFWLVRLQYFARLAKDAKTREVAA